MTVIGLAARDPQMSMDEHAFSLAGFAVAWLGVVRYNALRLIKPIYAYISVGLGSAVGP